jgi:hypothetical protein
MRHTFTHLFKDGRVASQIYEMDLQARTYQFITWEFSQPDVIDPLPVGECRAWLAEVDRHLAKLGFKLV